MDNVKPRSSDHDNVKPTYINFPYSSTTDLAITRSEVSDVIDMLQRKETPYPIDSSKCDYNLYGDHKMKRPYTNVLEGVNWYLSQDEIQHIPEELVIGMVAHNFGINADEALERVRAEVYGETGVVDLC